jgi:hypothetical protein
MTDTVPQPCARLTTTGWVLVTFDDLGHPTETDIDEWMDGIPLTEHGLGQPGAIVYHPALGDITRVEPV